MHETAIDWNALYAAFQLNTPDVMCFLNLHDGQVLRLPSHDPGIPRLQAATTHYAHVGNVAPRIQYEWVTEFLPQVENIDIRQRLEIAVNGKGAFKRFKNILMQLPEERRNWFEFRDRKLRVRIVAWVLEHGLRPNHPPPWDTDGGLELPPQQLISRIPSQSTGHPMQAALQHFLSDWMKRHGIHTISPTLIDALAADLFHNFRISVL